MSVHDTLATLVQTDRVHRSVYTDPALFDALIDSERQAGIRNRELVTEMFGPEIAASPNFALALDTTFNLMRGVAVTGILRQDEEREWQLVKSWAQIFTSMVSVDNARDQRQKVSS